MALNASWRSLAPGTPSGSGERTGATICYTDTAFELTYTATDAKVVDIYTECQSTVWMGDAIEFYIAPSNGADPIYEDADEYRPVFELDLGAGGALFGIEINNTDGHGGPAIEVPHCDGCPSCHPAVPSDSGLEWDTSLTADGWRGNLTVPFSVLYESNSDLLRRNWRANIYRMDWGTIAAGTPGGDWHPDKNIDQECYVDPDCNASVWAPTYCDERYPCNPEHLPRYFGALVLEGDGPWAEWDRRYEACEDDEDCTRYGATLGAEKAVGCAGCNTSHITLGGLCEEGNGADAMCCEKLCEASGTCKAYEWLGLPSGHHSDWSGMCYLFSKGEFAPALSRSKELVGGVVGRKPGGGGRHSMKLDDNAAPFMDNPKAAAHAIASQIINYIPAPPSLDESERTNKTHNDKTFRTWGYGQSIMIDAMMMAAERLGEKYMTVTHAGGNETVMTGWVNPLLTGFLKPGQPAAVLATGKIPPANEADKAIGDHIGLFPHAYLHRASYYTNSSFLSGPRPAPAGYDAAVDVKVARTTVNGFILKWPIIWTDGTITRDTPGHGMAALGPTWVNTSEHQFVWGDDAYMGITLPSRMILAGLDTPDFKYAQLCAEQSRLSVLHLKDSADGLFWHGVDAKTGGHSCCKWGRANGWTLMMQFEVIDALSASSWPGATAAKVAAIAVFQAHCEALAQVRS